MHKRRAFTLIELMIVIAIIALLMAILVPAIERVRKSAKDVICRSNLHQWGIIFKMFIDDHKGFFTEDLDWLRPLAPYYSRDPKVFRCPRAPKTKVQKTGSIRGGKFHAWQTEPMPELGRPGGVVGSYGYNQWLTRNREGTRGNLIWSTAYVKSAFQMPVLVDCANTGLTPYHKDNPPEYDGQVYFSDPTDIDEIRGACIDRHNESVNGCFGDWSARDIGLKELWELKWSRKWYAGHSSVTNYSPPVWPEWMKHMRDYARK